MLENGKDESKKEDGDVPGGGENSRRKSSPRDIPQDDERPAWSSKLQYILAQVGFSVGLGNVWRFPYLCQKNGGGAYLIPYTVLLLVIGIPLFFLELALGQRLRRGSIGVWNYIHPRLRGIGYASCVVCFLVALYYNVIIAWSIFYFSQSFQDPLPWKECPLVTDTNNTYVEPECKKSSATTYYWYRNTLDISESITDGGGLNWRMTLCLLCAWIIVCLAMIKGIQSTGKVMYFSSLFPYVVLICFLVRGLLLEGSVYGIAHMFTPKMETMLDITVWREAATQVFFALGLGFGGVIAFSSYNKRDNNCHLDAVLVPCINFFTSVMATLVVFAVLGFKANVTISKCVMKNVEKIDPALIPQFSDLNHVTPDDYQKMTSILNATMGSNYSRLGLEDCDIREELNKAVQGTGLAFIAFTEAMTQLPGSPFWSVMFFLMLINLGLGSMFGTIQGILTPILDTFKVRKEHLTVGCCVLAFGIGLIFVQRSGSYFVSMFDDYSATLPLLLVVFFENISVAWIYGSDKFFEDLTDMLGFTPSHIYYYMWKFITPVVLGILLVASIVQMGMSPPGYSGWNQELAEEQALSYPPWGLAICMSLVLIAILPVPVVLILNCLKIIDGHDKKAHVKNGTASPPGDEGEDAKLLDATPTSDAPTPGDSHNIAIDITLNKSQGSGYAISKIETSDMSESNM